MFTFSPKRKATSLQKKKSNTSTLTQNRWKDNWCNKNGVSVPYIHMQLCRKARLVTLVLKIKTFFSKNRKVLMSSKWIDVYKRKTFHRRHQVNRLWEWQKMYIKKKKSSLGKTHSSWIFVFSYPSRNSWTSEVKEGFRWRQSHPCWRRSKHLRRQFHRQTLKWRKT